MELVDLQIRRGDNEGSAVALVTLNDPGRRNALSSVLVGELITTISDLESNENVGVIILTGAPPVFCSGANLGNLAAERDHAAADDPDAEQRLRAIYEVFLRVANCSLPTVAAINGPAIGAGMNLALACDVRIAARSARFESRFTSLGLHPGGGHSYLLDRSIGQQGAAAMILFGETLHAEEAARRGLIWVCVDDAQLLDEAHLLASRAAKVPQELSKRVKATLRQSSGLDSYTDAVELEVLQQVWSLGEPFFAERLGALQAKISKLSP